MVAARAPSGYMIVYVIHFGGIKSLLVYVHARTPPLGLPLKGTQFITIPDTMLSARKDDTPPREAVCSKIKRL